MGYIGLTNMDFVDTTACYERWEAEQTAMVESDLVRKHEQMRVGVFPFFRATFYRWVQLWGQECRELDTAPVVLSVGDLHVENFGTWRDVEGRLVWGINDFDEAFPLPWTNDIVRLATSACLAIESEHLSVSRKDACDALLSGYEKGLASGGDPFVLAEGHDWLRTLALGKLRDPGKFWAKLASLSAPQAEPLPEIREALARVMPEPNLEFRIVHRIAGLGSLGRQRFVALTRWRGGMIAREAKALRPSACEFCSPRSLASRIYYPTILDSAIRSPDPFVAVRGHWVLRRLAPDCARIELQDIPKGHDELELLRAMGSETANIHLGTRTAVVDILDALKRRPKNWLHAAAKQMSNFVARDYDDWCSAEGRRLKTVDR